MPRDAPSIQEEINNMATTATATRPRPVAATKASTATATSTTTAKPTTKNKGGRPAGIITGPMLNWNDARDAALARAYKAGNTDAASLAIALAKDPAFEGVADRITANKIRIHWGSLQKRFAKRGMALPDLDRSGNGYTPDLDALGELFGLEAENGGEQTGGEAGDEELEYDDDEQVQVEDDEAEYEE